MSKFLTIALIVVPILLGACSGPIATTNPTAPAITQAPPSAVPPTETSQPQPTPEPIVLVDGLGREIEIIEPFQKIVSIAPSNTEILFAIGAGSQVVARDSFSDYPTEAASLPDVGGGWGELNTELIVSLEPDLVLAAEINAPEKVQMLEDLGLKTFYLANPKDIEGLYENLGIVAQLTGKEVEADVLVDSLVARVEAVDKAIGEPAERPLVFYELDGTEPNAPWTSGPNTFVDLLITRAGGNNLGSRLQDAWAQVSIELLISNNPQIILLGDAVWGGVTPEAVAARPGWEALDAVKNARVFPFDDNLVSRPGPRMVEGLEQLARLLHPELLQ